MPLRDCAVHSQIRLPEYLWSIQLNQLLFVPYPASDGSAGFLARQYYSEEDGGCQYTPLKASWPSTQLWL